MTDTTDNVILIQAINDSGFQTRCQLRYIVAAINITSESPATANHVERLSFAGALFAGTISLVVLAESIIANANVRAACLANPQQVGGNVLDSDIDVQVASTFTGMAISRVW
jgi:hypothetical protein